MWSYSKRKRWESNPQFEWTLVDDGLYNDDLILFL
jgi:hypothetical protein